MFLNLEIETFSHLRRMTWGGNGNATILKKVTDIMRRETIMKEENPALIAFTSHHSVETQTYVFCRNSLNIAFCQQKYISLSGHFKLVILKDTLLLYLFTLLFTFINSCLSIFCIFLSSFSSFAPFCLLLLVKFPSSAFAIRAYD